MRKLSRAGVLIACLAACLAVASAATAATSIPVSVSKDVNAFTTDIGCCIASTMSDPFPVALPRLGRLTAVADLDACESSCDPDEPTIFSIQFTARSGDTFVLVGSASGENLGGLSGTGTWSVLTTGPFAPTGRFAKIAGSGTWSATATVVGPPVEPIDGPPGADSILSLAVTGSLTLKK